MVGRLTCDSQLLVDLVEVKNLRKLYAYLVAAAEADVELQSVEIKSKAHTNFTDLFIAGKNLDRT